MTHELFIVQMKDKCPNIEILGKYLGDKEKIEVKCKICGNIWKDSPTHLKLGRGCSICKKLERKLKLLEDFILRSNLIHNNKYDYSLVKYKDQHTYVSIICPKHGTFDQIPNSHLRGRGCPKCAKENGNGNSKKTTEQFIKEANKIHNNKYDYNLVNYIGAHSQVTIICPIHGNFLQTPNHHLLGQGCPKCQLKSQTKLYEKLKKSFPNEKILFEVGKETVSWIGLQRFDIYFPEYNIAIEYNGKLHYIENKHFGGELGLTQTKYRDELKRQKCKENNCFLFELKYDYIEEDYNNLVYNISNIINNL